jgi:hypothetical protein
VADDATGLEGAGDPRAERDAILAGYRASWGGWLATLAEVPPERMAEAGARGDWSVKDLIGHVALWDARIAGQIGQILANEPRESFDGQALNEASAAANAARSLDDLMAEMRRSHEALTAALGGLATDDLDQLKLCRRAAEVAATHYKEHGAAVRAWLTRGET